ncbi:MAG TPA: FUSC family protein [Galbitalea sp.]|jgi:MFS family permease|nr:FUSC family protein [Galbitalea sp.]
MVEPSGDGDAGFDDTEPPPHPLRNWRPPVLTAVTLFAAVGLVALVDPNPGPLVLVAALAMTLARNRLVLTWRGRAEAIILLPVLGLATAGVGYLLLNIPIIGAAAYVLALFLSIWLRRFGPVWSRIGSLIALPFITLLIAPGAGSGATPLTAAVISIVALVVVVGIRLLAELVHFVPQRPKVVREQNPAVAPDAAPRPAEPSTAPTPTAPSQLQGPPDRKRIAASTKMALQMAIALAGAFILGFWLFPNHVSWVILTALIVCSGNRGRADVVYKSGLRIAGAAVGTVIASLGLLVLPAGSSALQGQPLVIVLLVILGLGTWLREWTYAAWAVAMTLVITLIQGALAPLATGGVPEGSELWMRILAIILGAACGVLASWFVLPVRSEGVVRRRLGGALGAISAFAADPNPLTDDQLAASLKGLDEVAAPWAAWERVSGWRKTARKPGEWMRLVHESARLVRRMPELSPDARRALGEARRSLRDPDAVGPALTGLRDQLRSGLAG